MWVLNKSTGYRLLAFQHTCFHFICTSWILHGSASFLTVGENFRFCGNRSRSGHFHLDSTQLRLSVGVAEGERREELGELGLSEGHLLHVVRRLIVCLQQTITSRNCLQVYLMVATAGCYRIRGYRLWSHETCRWRRRGTSCVASVDRTTLPRDTRVTSPSQVHVCDVRTPERNTVKML